MKCQLCRIEGDPKAADATEWTVHEGVDISQDEKRRLVQALDVLMEESEQEARNLVLHRFQRLFAVKQASPSSFERLKSEPTGMKRLNGELHGAMFEWLQAIRAFLDHTETRLKRRYGDDSPQCRAFDEATSAMFGSFFAYRFLYKLRNAQHVDFTPIGIVLSERVEHGRRVTDGSARFRRDDLLNGFSRWGTVKAELEQFPETFPMDEFVVTMIQCLDYIAYVVAEAERPYLEGLVGGVDEALSKVPTGRGFPAVCCVPDPVGSSGTIEMHPLFAVTLEHEAEPPKVIGRPTGRGDDWIVWEAP